MEFGIDSFAAAPIDPVTGKIVDSDKTLWSLVERIECADPDRKGVLQVFGVGEHYRREFLDSAPAVILGAASARTKKIRLCSAVSVLSSSDPVRLFQNFATLDLLSAGRAEICVGRGSFSESFPLFGFSFNDYDQLFIEKLDLLLKIRDQEVVSWKGKFRPPLQNQAIYPRPLQNPFPVWVGVGGTPESCIRAGKLGLPLMVAIIGGETKRFRPLVDLYRQAGLEAGHPPEQLKVGVHSPGYVLRDGERAIEEFYPGYAHMFTTIGQERGWSPVKREQYDHLVSPSGSFLIGSPEEVADKIIRHSEALGGIDRVTFQMDVAYLTQEQLLESIETIGKYVIPTYNSKIKNRG